VSFLSAKVRMNQVFIVTVPELPGCVTHGETYGETYEEAIQQGKDAIESWIDARIAWGKPVPKPDLWPNA